MSPDDTETVSDRAAESVSYAQVEINGMRIGIESAHVILALPRPASLTVLPRAHAAIDGVFSYDGQVIPVVDLRRWIDPAATHYPAMPHVVVLGSQALIIGLAVDAVRGLTGIRRSDIQQIYHDSADDRFFQKVAMIAATEQPVSLLDPLCLMEQVQSWANETASISSLTSTPAGTQKSAVADPAGEKTAIQVLVRVGGSVLSIPVQQVGEIITNVDINSLLSVTDILIGLMRWRGLDVAAIDFTKLLGTSSGNDAPKLMLMLTDGLLCAGLPIDEVVAVRQFSLSAVEKVTHIDLEYMPYYSGSVALDDGTRVLLVNSEALLNACPLNNLSVQTVQERRNRALTAVDEIVQGQATAQTYLVFCSEVLWACEIRQLKEILPLPADFKPVDEANQRGIVGTCEWRGALLPVLATSSVNHGDFASKRLIVVQLAEKLAGLLIDDVIELLPARQGIFSNFTTPEGNKITMITVISNADRRSYRIFDIAALPFFAMS
ncbi:chemotaxis signal transduction protein [Oxalobacteraceae bacterium GrIS 2.11]